jgi:hypothetical protein
MDQVDQWVAFFGLVSIVVTMRFSAWAVADRGLPGRGSSTRPSRRCSAKRTRQVVMGGGETSGPVAMVKFDLPSAAARTMRLRVARPAAAAHRRD